MLVRVHKCKMRLTNDARCDGKRCYFWVVRELGTFLLPSLYFSVASENFSLSVHNFYKNVLGRFVKDL